MKDLAEFLTGFVSQGATLSPVIDQTNLRGIYEYRMTFPLGEPDRNNKLSLGKR